MDNISGPPNLYSLGILRNIKEVLGGILLFLIPVGKFNLILAIESKFMGYTFEVNKENYEQLIKLRKKEKEEIKNKNILNKLNNINKN